MEQFIVVILKYDFMKIEQIHGQVLIVVDFELNGKTNAPIKRCSMDGQEQECVHILSESIQMPIGLTLD